MPALLGGTGIIGKDIFVKMKAQKSASIQTASGTVVTFPQSEERAFSGLNVYGHSTQSGTPSPENPVPIVSAGSVMTTGAQLLDLGHTPVTSSSDKYEVGYTVTKDGLTATVQADGGIKITGTKTTEGWTNIFWVVFQRSNLPSIPAGEYTITAKKQNQAISIRISGLNYSNTFTLNEDSQIIGWYIAYSGIQTVNDIVYPMLNAGSTALPWEPYTGGVPGVNPYAGEINVSVSDGGTQSQTLTLSTPGGLPGIPVLSGGNYTDESGQQWVCNEIDLKRGKYVQYIKKIILDGTEGDWLEREDFAYGFYTGELMTNAICNYFPSAQSINDVGQTESIYAIKSTLLVFTYLSAQDLDEWKIWLSQHPVTVYYTLATPIETDLPAEEIAAYKALHTYSPTTTVTNDADAWMKVGYNEFSKQTF